MQLAPASGACGPSWYCVDELLEAGSSTESRRELASPRGGDDGHAGVEALVGRGQHLRRCRGRGRGAPRRPRRRGRASRRATRRRARGRARRSRRGPARRRTRSSTTPVVCMPPAGGRSSYVDVAVARRCAPGSGSTRGTPARRRCPRRRRPGPRSRRPRDWIGAAPSSGARAGQGDREREARGGEPPGGRASGQAIERGSASRTRGSSSAGRCLIPLMKFDWSRSGSPDGADVGHPLEQLLEHHGDLAPGQVGAEAEVRARARRSRGGRSACGRGRSGTGRRTPAASRLAEAVPEHDLVALVEGLVADAGAVLGDGAPEVDHRRGPAHDLLHRRAARARRSRPPSERAPRGAG